MWKRGAAVSLERKTLAARYDEENVEFILWLAKQADGGYGVKRGQLLNRAWSFLRALYMMNEDALTPIGVQRLLCIHGLPLRAATSEAGLGNALHPQARFNFFSRLTSRAASGS